MAKVLVTYGSKRGSTAEIAESIAKVLEDRNFEVVCESVKSAPPAKGFDAAVIGSGVYAGRWRGSARRYLKRNSEALKKIPFWIFSSGPVGEQKEDADDAEKWLEPKKVIASAESAGVREHVVFGGRMPLEPENFVERAMVKNTPAELRDLRDWDEIRAWAGMIADSLA